jgi:uncharacterized OB-fold protein
MSAADHSDAAFFRDGVALGRLLVRVCDACGRGAFPPMPGCPHCGHEQGSVVESAGHGTLHSWTVCHVAFDPAFADQVPYVVGLVDLPEGARLIARVEGADHESLRDGLPLVAAFPRDTDGSRRLTFVPSAGGGAA